jgi:hypothetical protein
MSSGFEEKNRVIVAALRSGAPYLFIKGDNDDDGYALVQVGTERIPLKVICYLITGRETYGLEILSRALSRGPVEVLNWHVVICVGEEDFKAKLREMPTLFSNDINIAATLIARGIAVVGRCFLKLTDQGIIFGEIARGKQNLDKYFFYWTGKVPEEVLRNLLTRIFDSGNG